MSISPFLVVDTERAPKVRGRPAVRGPPALAARLTQVIPVTEIRRGGLDRSPCPTGPAQGDAGFRPGARTGIMHPWPGRSCSLAGRADPSLDDQRGAPS